MSYLMPSWDTSEIGKHKRILIENMRIEEIKGAKNNKFAPK